MDSTHGKHASQPPRFSPFHGLYSQDSLFAKLPGSDFAADPLAMLKAKKRPRSRGSTASVHSATTQPNLEHSFQDAPDVYATHWMSNDHPHSRELVGGSNQMTPEELLLASQLQASRDFSLDGGVNASMQSISFHPSHSMSRQSLSAESFAGNTSFADDSQMMDRDGNDDNESFVGGPGNSKPGSRSSANNELEMRQLFTANKHRNLVEVAEELHGNERGPNSERTRQVFAMLWYANPCS